MRPYKCYRLPLPPRPHRDSRPRLGRRPLFQKRSRHSLLDSHHRDNIQGKTIYAIEHEISSRIK